MIKDTGKQTTVNALQLSRRKLKSFLSQQLGDACGNDIRLHRAVFHRFTIGLLFVIALDAPLRAGNVNVAFDMRLCGLQQIGRSF